MSPLEHQDRIDQLLAEIQSILLATVHRDGSPLASYTPYAVEVIRGDAPWDRGIAGLRDRHGGLVDTLITLSDFRLFHLLPQSGRYIVGFGQAYELKPGSLTTIDHHLQGPTGPQNDSAG